LPVVSSITMAGAIRMTRSPHHKMSLAAYMILFMTHYTSKRAPLSPPLFRAAL
jgi:hypothetical protein